MQSDSLGPDTLIGLASGFTSSVDERDPSDYMSLLREVVVCTPLSSLIHRDVGCPGHILISELDRASEIFALSYLHRMHVDQTRGLRNLISESCGASCRVLGLRTAVSPRRAVLQCWWLGPARLTFQSVRFLIYAIRKHTSRS